MPITSQIIPIISEWRIKMNHAVTSKELLLETAKKIAYKDGIASVSIRRAAKESNIAIGTIYNYYASKEELIAAILEDFWRSIFHNAAYDFKEQSNFVESILFLYEILYHKFQSFQSQFLNDMVYLTADEKEKSRQLESDYYKHMEHGLLLILEKDTTISSSIWSDQFTKQQFIHFILEYMILQLRHQMIDISFFKQLLLKILYPIEKE